MPVPLMQEPTIKFLRENWFLFLFIGGLVMGWTNFQSNITALERRLARVEVQADTGAVAIATINTQLAQIQTTLEFIKQQLAAK